VIAWRPSVGTIASIRAVSGCPSIGAVVHTLNLRLHPSELAYIANHAKDKVLVVDKSLLPPFGELRAQLETVEHVIVVLDSPGAIELPLLEYESLLSKEEVVDPGVGFGPCWALRSGRP
jgi:fatty-acyl-CoA synthase